MTVNGGVSDKNLWQQVDCRIFALKPVNNAAQLKEEELFLNVFFSGTFPGELVGGSVGRKVTLSDFHCGGAFGLSQSVRGPRDVIYFLTALTNSLQTSISKLFFC